MSVRKITRGTPSIEIYLWEEGAPQLQCTAHRSHVKGSNNRQLGLLHHARRQRLHQCLPCKARLSSGGTHRSGLPFTCEKNPLQQV
jgi:hypothetical protein